MSITVKKLISELEKIENKFLEVEIYDLDSRNYFKPIEGVRKTDKKILILTEVKLFR